jgi:hypothetical protein
MFKLKHWGIAAALAVTTVGSAMASNFRVSDQVYLPLGGHLVGGSGTFITDIFLTNLSNDAVDVSITFSSTGPGNIRRGFPKIVLQPRERREFPDFFATQLGITNDLGLVIFNGCKSGTLCDETTQNDQGVSPNFRNISVEGRVYSALAATPGGTTGVDVPGIPWYSFVTMDQSATGLDKVFMTGIRNTPAYRTNVTFVNASEYASATQLRATLFNGATGAQIDQPWIESLGALGHVQRSVGSMFPSFTGVNATNAWIQVEQLTSTAGSNAPAGCSQTGCPAFFTVAYSLDNVTGDPTQLEPQYFVPLNDAALLAIYPSSAGKSPMRRVAKH